MTFLIKKQKNSNIYFKNIVLDHNCVYIFISKYKTFMPNQSCFRLFSHKFTGLRKRPQDLSGMLHSEW